jgi:hypothetical protein
LGILGARRMTEVKSGRDRHIIIDPKSDTVIKVAKNKEGLEQNYNEYMFNKRRPDITARVDYYGVEFLIMEKVTPIDQPKIQPSYDLVVDKEQKDNKEYQAKLKDLLSYWGKLTQKERDLIDKYWHTLKELNKELGDSLDNYQLGITPEGKVVAYDYGHNSEFIKRTLRR